MIQKNSHKFETKVIFYTPYEIIKYKIQGGDNDYCYEMK